MCEKRIAGEILYSVLSGSHDVNRDSVYKANDCLVSRYQLELCTNKLKLYYITFNTLIQLSLIQDSRELEISTLENSYLLTSDHQNTTEATDHLHLNLLGFLR